MTFKEIAEEIGNLVEEKNAAYGNSFITTGEIMKLIYPNGIRLDQMTDALLTVRVLDKLNRIAHEKGAFNESEWRDISGYGLCGAYKDEVDNTPVETLEILKDYSPNSTGTVVVPFTGQPLSTGRSDGGWVYTPSVTTETLTFTVDKERCTSKD